MQESGSCWLWICFNTSLQPSLIGLFLIGATSTQS